MTKKRVHEIAKEQGIQAKDLIAKLQAAGVDVKAAASTVEEADALRAIGGAAAPAKVANGTAPTPASSNGGGGAKPAAAAAAPQTAPAPVAAATPTATAEATPACSAGAAPMAVEVRGATVMARPMANTSTAGKTYSR